MKILIVEDEQIAVDRLTQLLGQLIPNIEIVGHVDTVLSAVQWFKDNTSPDLAFFDIQLADGVSFNIFEQVDVSCPIIFTTAYDQYAIQAFKVNSIDYLLKPLTKDDLKQALDKFNRQGNTSIDTNQIIRLLNDNQTKKVKERFIIKVGEHLKSVLTVDIALFYSEDRTTYIIDKEGNKYILDHTLDHLEDIIDARYFFRISRKFIVHIDRITDILSYSKSRLKVSVQNFNSDDMVVSRDRVLSFKKWLDR